MYNDDYLAHYGVLGMKWGVRRSSNYDSRLADRSRTLAAKSAYEAKRAKQMANSNTNGSRYLERSNRHMKRANKFSSKMSDGGKSVRNTEEFTSMRTENKEAAKHYIQRTSGERVKSLVTSSSVSLGASFVGMAMGMPVGLLYMEAGPQYKLRVEHSDYSDILIHWGEKEDHKYIAKVKRPNGKWRYFYDKEEYKNYLNKGKNTVDKLVSKVKSSSEDIFKKIKFNTYNSDKKTKGKSFVDKFSTQESKAFVFLIKRDTVKKAVDWLSNKFGFTKSESINDVVTEKPKEGHKYIAKVKTPNGKFRYFYDQDEYDSYLKRLEYQNKEPEFMKQVPDINKNDIYTSLEDMDKINETYNPHDLASSTNCSNCSAAYELRRRGYDVEAKLRDDEYNGRGDRVYDYFEGAEKMYVFGDGTTHVASEYFERKVWDDKATSNDAKKYNTAYKYYTNDQSYTTKTIEQAIKNNNPPGSRGFIDVEWKKGGGHSIVYEVSKTGKVTIKDSQTYDEYSVSELADKVSRVSITRTDNLQLKKDILDTVRKNTDGDRKYYVDKNTLQYYDD